jgi:predicted O-methyltransferase YrrM
MRSGLAEQVLRRIENSCRRWYLPIVGPERGRILADMVRRHRPKRILEVGTFIGYSAILMARELEEGSTITSIEIDPEEAEEAKANIRAAGLDERVKVFVGDALDVIPKIEGRFDMVFLDAEKSKYLNYLKLVEDRLPRGSVIVADNARSLAHSMRDYLEYVRNSGKYDSTLMHGGWDGLEVSIKL